MKSHINVRNAVVALVALGLALLPVYSELSGNIFILTLFTRIVILALAAASLNLIMGFGGMMSFGHAAYLGIGGYPGGLPAAEGGGRGVIPISLAPAAPATYPPVMGAPPPRPPRAFFIMLPAA